MLNKTAFIWSKIQSYLLQFKISEYILKCHLFLWSKLNWFEQHLFEMEIFCNIINVISLLSSCVHTVSLFLGPLTGAGTYLPPAALQKHKPVTPTRYECKQSLNVYRYSRRCECEANTNRQFLSVMFICVIGWHKVHLLYNNTTLKEFDLCV